MKQLPSGTLTILFTDIEGSTQLLQQLGAEYQQILDIHHRILREAITSHDGFEVNTEGDSFFAVFPRASDALGAAVSAQINMHTFSWPNSVPLRVRMGLHTGAPTLTGSDYMGLDIHRAARIASAAHGGQILLSSSVHELCQDSLPQEITLLDLGLHMLKDLQRPEHIYQVIISGLQAEFPPIKSLEYHYSLPIQSTSLIGRTTDIAKICALLKQDQNRLITLIGPGGIGKTRLAIQTTAELSDFFRDGVSFIAMASVQDEHLAPAAIAQALGMRETASQSPIDWLKTFLSRKNILLTLDNVEQIISAAPFFSELLVACPDIKILATSRAALRIRGEKEYIVPPLGLPDRKKNAALNAETLSQYAAVALFIERACDVSPNFQVNNTNAPAIAEICLRIDGLPLAIELAASRMKHMTPATLLSRLSNRLKMLSGGSQDLPKRQQTLHNLISWSYDLLSAEEQSLFRRLSVFAGGCAVEAAEQVCLAPENLPELSIDILDGLCTLVDNSLIQRQDIGETRYMILATIREYGAAQLNTSSEKDAVWLAYATYYLAIAEQAEKHTEDSLQNEWLSILELEHDNISAALFWAIEEKQSTIAMRFAGALWRFWSTRGYLSEAAMIFEALFPESAENSNMQYSAIDKAVQLKALYAAGSIAILGGNYERSLTLLSDGLHISAEADSDIMQAQIMNSIAVCCSYQCDYEKAAKYFAESLVIYQKAQHQHGIAIAQLNLGEIEYLRNNVNTALEYMLAATEYFQKKGDTTRIAIAYTNLANIYREQQNTIQAVSYIHQALQLYQNTQNLHGIAEILESYCKIIAQKGDTKLAAQIFGAAEKLRDQLGEQISPSAQKEIDRYIPVAQRNTEWWAAERTIGYSMPLEQIIRQIMNMAK